MFRRIAEKIIIGLLRLEARLVLKKYKPKIIAVTGSVGKTGTKEAIYAVWKNWAPTRRSQKSFNHEIGIPLTILNLPNAWRNPWAWLKNLAEGLGLIVFRSKYPEWLILEVGVEKPGDIERLVRWLKTDGVVVTQLPDVPVHVEFFASPEDVKKEKLALLKSLRPGGVAVLNHDDESIMAAAGRDARRTLTYGFKPGADLEAGQVSFTYSGERSERFPTGLQFNLNYKGLSLPVSLPGILGEHQIYAALAALGLAASVGLDLPAAAKNLLDWTPPPGRLRPLAGLKGTLILDDTYNASPAATRAALYALQKIEVAGRRLAVLGDMLELGSHSHGAHQATGEVAAEVCNRLLTVGLRAKAIGEAAIQAKGKLTNSDWKHFSDAKAAGEALQRMLVPGDVVLIKGSQGMRMERAVEEVMAHPEAKLKLLCRQETEWLNKK
jgi:UDP-N-acetylmuramoyl-tripeptide--D-alanyl-D-alanine ligase